LRSLLRDDQLKAMELGGVLGSKQSTAVTPLLVVGQLLALTLRWSESYQMYSTSPKAVMRSLEGSPQPPLKYTSVRRSLVRPSVMSLELVSLQFGWSETSSIGIGLQSAFTLISLRSRSE